MLIPTPIQRTIARACGIDREANYNRHTLLRADDIRAVLADKIGGVIVHRINFPKTLCGKVSRKASLNAKMRPLLSEQEVQDAKQTVALALLATGGLDRMAVGERLTVGDWKVAFRAVRGADCLRIDRKAKSGNEQISIDAMLPEETAFLAMREGLPTLPLARRNIVARKVRYARACAFAAHREGIGSGEGSVRFVYRCASISLCASREPSTLGSGKAELRGRGRGRPGRHNFAAEMIQLQTRANYFDTHRRF